MQILSIWLITLFTGRRDSYRGGRYSRNCGKVSSYEWVKATCVYMRKLFMKNLRRLSERPHPEKEGTKRTRGEVRCPRFLETHYREIHYRNRRHWCKTCCSFRCMEYGTYNSAQIMWIVQMHLPNWKILQFEQDANDIRAHLVAAKDTHVSNTILIALLQVLMTCAISSLTQRVKLILPILR